MKQIVLALFAWAAVTNASAVAQTTSSPDPAASQSTAPQKKICRSSVVTGSMMATRVCHTKQEWTAIDKANGAAAGKFYDQRNSNGGIRP